MRTYRRLSQRTFIGLLLAAGLLTLTWLAYQPDTVPVDSIAEEPYYQDPDLLERAWAQPVAATYQDGFEYQINWAFCGPATVVNLFRSLGMEGPTQDTLFDNAAVSYWKARLLGLTLDEPGALEGSDDLARRRWLDLFELGDLAEAVNRDGGFGLEFDYTYDGPGIAKGGSGELSVDGAVVATGKQANSIAFLQVSDETFDVGVDTRTEINVKDYQLPFDFTGTIDKLTIDLGPTQFAAADQQKAGEAKAKASD